MSTARRRGVIATFAACAALASVSSTAAAGSSLATPTWIDPPARYLAVNSNINNGPYVATNARGDTAVAWLDPLTKRVKVSERPVGGVFSPAKIVIGAPDQHLGGVAIDGDGTIYAFLITENSNPMYSQPVVATKPVGSGVWAGEFLAPASTADPAQGGITGVVSPSGKVLVTWFQGHTADASKSRLEFRVKPAGSDTWTPKGDVPGVTWNTSEHQLAMNAAGEAALIYTKPACNLSSSNMLFGATMTAANVWTTANQITACDGPNNTSVTGSAVAIDAKGNATAAWTHLISMTGVVQYSTKTIVADAWPEVPLHSATNDLSPAGPNVAAPGLAIEPDGATTIAWGDGSAVKERRRSDASGTFTPAQMIPHSPSAPYAPVLRAAPDGSVIALSSNASGSVIGGARRAPGAASFTALPDLPGSGNGKPALGVDDEGNASVAWVHTYDGPQYSVQATGLDVAGPTITNVIFPSTQPVDTLFPYGAEVIDRWSPGTSQWTFGDGTTGPLSGTKAYKAAGNFDAVLTATDVHGNKTTASRSIAITAPAAGGGGAAGSSGGAGGSGGGGGGGPVADATAPVFLSAGISNARFRVDAAGAAEPLALASAAKRGTTFRFALSEAAAVRFAIRRRVPGRRVAGKCVKPAHANFGKRRCARCVAVGAFTSASVSGPNAKRFSGKLGTRRLAVGRYRVRLTAVDAAGNRSAPKTIAMRVVRR
jgi:hypothetical protein